MTVYWPGGHGLGARLGEPCYTGHFLVSALDQKLSVL